MVEMVAARPGFASVTVGFALGPLLRTEAENQTADQEGGGGDPDHGGRESGDPEALGSDRGGEGLPAN